MTRLAQHERLRRAAYAWGRRQEGALYREIGDEIGVSVPRAREIVHRFEMAIRRRHINIVREAMRGHSAWMQRLLKAGAFGTDDGDYVRLMDIPIPPMESA